MKIFIYEPANESPLVPIYQVNEVDLTQTQYEIFLHLRVNERIALNKNTYLIISKCTNLNKNKFELIFYIEKVADLWEIKG